MNTLNGESMQIDSGGRLSVGIVKHQHSTIKVMISYWNTTGSHGMTIISLTSTCRIMFSDTYSANTEGGG